MQKVSQQLAVPIHRKTMQLSQMKKSTLISITVLKIKEMTLTVNSSAESQEPIFSNAVKAGAAAEPNSSAEDNKGSICKIEEKK